jgi:hypothetical protein
MIFAAAGMGVVWLTGAGLINRASAQQTGQAAAAAKTQTAGEAFKNVTTSSLKGLTVDDFLEAMGVISADLGLDCADCHPGAGSDRVDWVVDTERKKTTRKMVEMLANINRTNFAGAQAVTCFSCHHGRLRPTTTIALDKLYGPPNEEQDDLITPATDVPTPTQVLDKYVQALGGAQKLATVKSYIATGSSVGYGGLGGGGKFQIIAQAPDTRMVSITFPEHPERGESMRAYNGKVAWVKSPRALVKEYDVVGTDLNVHKLDAQMSFPAQIKTALTNLRSGPPDNVNGHDVYVIQGNGGNRVLATLYFDRQSGLLVRTVMYGVSPVGRIPRQADFDDYRDVNGIKFPFKYQYSWLDGREQYQLTDVKVNAPIDAKLFQHTPSPTIKY